MKGLIALLALAVTLKSGDSAFTGWTTPSISSADGSGSISINENQATGITSITIAATVDTGSVASYTDTSSSAVFTIASGTGVVTLVSALNFATTPSYTLTIEAVDDQTPPNTAIATVTINVNTAPAFAVGTYGATIAEGSTSDWWNLSSRYQCDGDMPLQLPSTGAEIKCLDTYSITTIDGATVTTVTATDGNTGDTLTYTINSGDATNDFDIASGVITVTSGTTIASSTLGGYALEIYATDTGTLVGSSTVYVAVTSAVASMLLAGSSLFLLMACIPFLN